MTTEFILSHGEEFVQCPYNVAHQITNARLLTHLEKCRKAFTKDLSEESRRRVIKICRFNANHHVPQPELKFHEDRCHDAFRVVTHMAYHNSEEGNKKYEERRKQDHCSRRSPSPPSKSRHSHSHSKKDKEKVETKVQVNEWGLQEEDWESECVGDAPGYDPLTKLKTEVVIYNPAGLTKSERKNFRTEMRQKAAEHSLKGEPVEFPTASTFDLKPEIKNIKDIKVEVGRNSPLEPGEIDDGNDAVDNGASKTIKRERNNSGHSGSRDDDHHRRDIKHERRDSHSSSGRRDSHYDRRDSRSSDRRDRDSHHDRRDRRSSDRRDRDSNYDRRDSHYDRRDSRSDGRSSTSSRSNHVSSSSKSSYSRLGHSRTERIRDDYSSDSDDFAGIDPYI